MIFQHEIGNLINQSSILINTLALIKDRIGYKLEILVRFEKC